MAENQRFEELRRRVLRDPASVAFAALAEEYRCAGQLQDAIATCRAGLLRHPAYLSARVTLGRALIEAGELQEARTHLEHVLRAAPDNLAATRALEQIHYLEPQAAAIVHSDGATLATGGTAADTTETARARSSHAVEGTGISPDEQALGRLEAFLAGIVRARRQLEGEAASRDCASPYAV